MNVALRDYQERGVVQLYDAFRQGFQKVIFVNPTGGGKTTTSGYVVKACVRKKKRVLIFMHRTHLCKQFAKRLRDQFNVSCGFVRFVSSYQDSTVGVRARHVVRKVQFGGEGVTFRRGVRRRGANG